MANIIAIPIVDDPPVSSTGEPITCVGGVYFEGDNPVAVAIDAEILTGRRISYTLTPAELKAARRRLGLSCAKLAAALQMGKHGGRAVRRWEAGESPIPGPVAVAVSMMLVGAR